MELDALFLSRVQFAFTISFHIIFPAFTIGLASWLVALEFQWLRTGQPIYRTLFRFWVKVFAISFGLGVVSGIVMSYQFGTNWSRFSDFAGNIVGPLMAYEVLTAFFLEASFLGIMLFGWEKVGDRLHFLSTCLVALGTLVSAFWILSANSWMQTPDGYKLVDGQFQPVSWLHVIFNPSFGIRFVHMLVGALIAAAWFIAGISAWYLLKRRHLPIARRGVSVTLGVLAILVPVQMFIGDNVAGGYVAKYKLSQLEAMEGNWDSTNTGENFAVIPNQGAAKNDWQVTVPWLGSAIAKDWSGKTPMPGLKLTPKELRPQMLPTFYGFHLMWWSAVVMLGVALIGIALRLRGRLYSARWFHRVLVGLVPIGVVATWAGWVLAETGRQPWLVYGKLLTADAVSPLKPAAVLTTLIAFVLVYLALLGTYIWYVARVVRDGPDDGPIGEPSRPRAAPTLEPSPGLAPAG